MLAISHNDDANSFPIIQAFARTAIINKYPSQFYIYNMK